MTDSIKETIKETVNHQAETPTNTKTKAVLNQAVADLSVAASIVHQVHWYMRGPGFLYLHPKMDELMDSLNSYLDKISERLITIGGEPYSTLVEFSSNSGLTETTGTFDQPMSDRILSPYLEPLLFSYWLIYTNTCLSCSKLAWISQMKKEMFLQMISLRMQNQKLIRRSGC